MRFTLDLYNGVLKAHQGLGKNIGREKANTSQ